MNSNSTKQNKKLLTELFADHSKEMCEMFYANEKSFTEMIEENNKITNEELEMLSAEMRSNSDNAKYLTVKTKDLKEGLTVLTTRSNRLMTN